MDVHTEPLYRKRRPMLFVTLEILIHYYRACVDNSIISVGMFTLLVYCCYTNVVHNGKMYVVGLHVTKCYVHLRGVYSVMYILR